MPAIVETEDIPRVVGRIAEVVLVANPILKFFVLFSGGA
jgi:hypothetical protein